MSSPTCAETTLRESMIRAWMMQPLPAVSELQALWYEYGPEFHGVFAGKTFLEVERDPLDEGSALLYMAPHAALHYLASYMLAVLDHLPMRREGQFALDQRLNAHLLGCLGDAEFLGKLRAAGLTPDQAQVIHDFLTLTRQAHELLSLAPDEIQTLELTQHALRQD